MRLFFRRCPASSSIWSKLSVRERREGNGRRRDVGVEVEELIEAELADDDMEEIDDDLASESEEVVDGVSDLTTEACGGKLDRTTARATVWINTGSTVTLSLRESGGGSWVEVLFVVSAGVGGGTRAADSIGRAPLSCCITIEVIAFKVSGERRLSIMAVRM